MIRAFDTIRLASSDIRHEWKWSLCLALGLAAVLAPLLVLFGVKYGFLSALQARLTGDPHFRELKIVSNAQISEDWIRELRERNDVAFVVPRTRTIAATVSVRLSPDADRPQTTDLIPTGPGDPLLSGELQVPKQPGEVAISYTLAEKLKIDEGTGVTASVSRRVDGTREEEELELLVVAVLSPAAIPGDAIFGLPSLLVAVENYRDGYAVPDFNWRGRRPNPAQRSYSGIRLYAKSIYDVATIRNALVDQDLEVQTEAAEIELVQSLDSGLTRIFWIIATIGVVGYTLSLGASIWGYIERKRRDLSVMRLLGFSTTEIVAFPVIQSLYVAILGATVAGLFFLVVQALLNNSFEAQLQVNELVCELELVHFINAVLLTLVFSTASSVLGGIRASRVEASDGIRDV